jgi:hypothetical protein
MRCFTERPVSDWECGDDGIAQVKEGRCDAEQGRYVECLAGIASR